MKTALQGYLLWLAVSVIVTLLLATVAGLCLAALYLYLIGVIAAPFAALITAGCALFLVGLVVFGARLACKCGCAFLRRTGKPRIHGEAGDVLDSVLIGLVTDWIKANAKKATFAGLLAGVAAGTSPELRRLLIRILQKSGNSE